MARRKCYHCKQWIEEGQAHDCWTTTEAALTQDLPADLREAWARVREKAVEFGDQRIYASHKSIMFSRQSCYFFVRPKRNFLELCVFLGREVKAPQMRRVDRASKSKIVHFMHITHRDEVEAPVTDWLREAYDLSAATSAKAAAKPKRTPRPAVKPKAGKISTPKNHDALESMPPKVTFAMARKIALTLPDVEAGSMYGAPALKLHGRLLACLAINKSAEPDSLVVSTGFDERTALLSEEPATYYVTDHYVNYPVVLVRMAKIGAGQLQDLLRSAWRFVTAQEKQKPSRRSVAIKATTTRRPA